MAITNNLQISRIGVYLLSLLVLTMVIVPLAAAALTVTADKAEYVPDDTLVVSGTATPSSAVTIRVYDPADVPRALAQVSTDSDGAYSVTVLVWPSTATTTFPFGTYRISVIDAGNGDSTETTVEFGVTDSQGVRVKSSRPVSFSGVYPTQGLDETGLVVIVSTKVKESSAEYGRRNITVYAKTPLIH